MLASPNTIQRIYRVEDEIASAVTHGIGLALSIVGLIALTVLAAQSGTVWQIVGASIYGASLVVLYAASTVYHCARGYRTRAILRVVDHACIFLLIAGTYTPFTLTALRGPWGWTLLALVWTFALAGIGHKLYSARRGLTESAIPYIIMGWLAIIAIKPLIASVSLSGLAWLLAGGLCYTFGTLFYRCEGRRYFHAIWHVFVLAGSAFHFCAVLFHAH